MHQATAFLQEGTERTCPGRLQAVVIDGLAAEGVMETDSRRGNPTLELLAGLPQGPVNG